MQQISFPGRWSGLGNSNISLAPRERRLVRGASAAQGGDHYNQHHPYHCRPTAAAERHAAREERHQQGAGNTAGNLASGSSDPSSVQTSPTTPAQTSTYQPPCSTTASPPCSKQPERVSSSSESLTPGGGGNGASQSGGVKRGGGDHHPPSLIPRAVGASASSSLHSLASRGSSTQNISSSDRASPTPPTPSSASSSSSSSAFTGRLGQPPRGPLSLHSYSRKNVFLQHSLHTAELQALTQRDS